MARVIIEFEDNESFTKQEIEYNNRVLFGSETKVTTLPNNSSPEEYISFGLRELVTIDQLEIFYSKYPNLYPQEIEELKENTLKVVEQLLDKVFKENEERLV